MSGKINTSTNPSQLDSCKTGGVPPPVSQVATADQKEQNASGTEAEVGFQLSGLQHTQVLQAVFEQQQVGVAIVGLHGRILQASPAFASLLHYKQEHLVGKSLKAVMRGAGQARNIKGEAGLPGKHQASPTVKQFARKSGETISCLTESHAILDENGKTTHFLVFIADARSGKDPEERDRFERELYRSQALQVLGVLAGGVAHDFNNALEVILGFASLARARLSVTDPLHEPLKVIEESAKGAAGLARQLLDISQEKPDDERDIDVSDLFKAVIAIISRTFDRKIQIEHRVQPQVPCVRGIQNRLEQAMLNLCINSRDAMREGEP